MHKTCFVICFFIAVAHAQLPKASDFFPLQVGNVWQYEDPFGYSVPSQEEIIGDTLLGDTLLVYKARYTLDPENDPFVRIRYYNYNIDSTVVYAHNYFDTDSYHDFRMNPYDALVLIDTRNNLENRWEWIVGDYEAMFAVTDIGQTGLFGQIRQWAVVSSIVSESDSFVVDGQFWCFVNRIGITKIGGLDTLSFARINGVEYGIPLSVQEGSHVNYTIPNQFTMRVYPNPFNGTTTISFNVEKYQHVNITVYDILGKRVRTLINSYRDTGSHKIIWDGRDQYGNATASGLYFVRISTPEKSQVLKVSYLK